MTFRWRADSGPGLHADGGYYTDPHFQRKMFQECNFKL